MSYFIRRSGEILLGIMLIASLAIVMFMACDLISCPEGDTTLFGELISRPTP